MDKARVQASGALGQAAAIDLVAPLVDLAQGEGVGVHVEDGQGVAVGVEAGDVIGVAVLGVQPALRGFRSASGS